jgi:coenzyme PQQ biosynthesis protein PqqD
MSPSPSIRRPALARGSRYRWDELRRQHELVFPEGVLVLNDSAAAVVRLCDGRSTEEVVAALGDQFPGSRTAGDVAEFLERLARKGLLRDDADA